LDSYAYRIGKTLPVVRFLVYSVTPCQLHASRSVEWQELGRVRKEANLAHF